MADEMVRIRNRKTGYVYKTGPKWMWDRWKAECWHLDPNWDEIDEEEYQRLKAKQDADIAKSLSAVR